LLWSATYNAAETLNAQHSAGALEAGKRGDVAIWNVPDLESLAYHFGDLRARAVVIGGEIAWQDSDATSRY
jgi:imidazolonepropionase